MKPSHPGSRLRASWRRFGARMFTHAMDDNIAQIASAVAPEPPRVLDLGCWDGTTTVRYAPPGAAIFGLDVSHEAAREARVRSLTMVTGDLHRRLPWRDGSFDVVTSNQVIEHVADTDLFLSESYRVLAPGGLLVASTENMSSWHNIAALVLGWQAFSLTNVSQKTFGIGNPLANLRGDEPLAKGWEHLRIFSWRGLLELVRAHGFVDVRILGAGYYPLPSRLGRLDPRHAAFITVVGRRPAHGSP